MAVRSLASGGFHLDAVKQLLIHLVWCSGSNKLGGTPPRPLRLASCILNCGLGLEQAELPGARN